MNTHDLQPIGLAHLEEMLNRDLILIQAPSNPWMIEPQQNGQQHIYDVAIIGAGMAGMAAGLALLLQGIYNIRLFDAQSEGYEGPWPNHARMRTLRSHKALMGPALHLPHLTFQAWFQAQFGAQAWDNLYKIPTQQWMDYLKWYRRVTHLPIDNNRKLSLVRPKDDLLHLQFDELKEEIRARKVILATGREGFGGQAIPSFVHSLPKSCYAHTSERIDFNAFQNRRIGVIGGGASAFDAAAVTLENGAKNVDMLLRRPCIPNVNKVASLNYPGFTEGFYQLSDEVKLKFMKDAAELGTTPPFESLNRLKPHSNVNIRTNTLIESAEFKDNEIILQTTTGAYSFDFLILGTGFTTDGFKQTELRLLMDHILLWKDTKLALQLNKSKQNSPYLGAHFQFLEKEKGAFPYLKDLYCFNYAATLSHGWVSSDIPDISYGALRLAKGIASDFFIEDWQVYDNRLHFYNKPEFLEEDYFFINKQ